MARKKESRAERTKRLCATKKAEYAANKRRQDSTVAGRRKGKRRKAKAIGLDGITEDAVQARYAKAGYPVQWNIALRRSIRQRDGGQCVICAKTNQDERRDSGFAALPVHHIDKDKSNCDPCNLITICTDCHTLQHGGDGILTAEQLVKIATAREWRVYLYTQ